MSVKPKRESTMNQPNSHLTKTEINQGKYSKPLLPLKTGSSLMSDKKLTLGSIKPTSIGSAVTEDTSNQRDSSLTENVNKTQVFGNVNLIHKGTESFQGPVVSKDNCSPGFKQKAFSDKMCVASLYKKIYGLSLSDAIKSIEVKQAEEPRTSKQESGIAVTLRPVVKNPLYQSFDFNFDASVKGSFRKKAMSKLKQKQSVSKMLRSSLNEKNSKSVIGTKKPKNTKNSMEQNSLKKSLVGSSDFKNTHENFVNSYREIKNRSKERRMVSGNSIFKEKIKSTIILA